MKVHHLNCISTCPLGGALMDGRSGSLRAKLACHCLLVETATGLVLVDTGLGTLDCTHPRPRLSRFFLMLLSPEFRLEMTAVHQIEALGYDPDDVRHILLSHLDFDHAGGLDDFPRATVHMLESERASAEAQRTLLDRMRYRPQQWSTRDHWRVYEEAGGDDWMGFRSAKQLDGLGPDFALVPLIGHTLGHAGIAIRNDAGWLLYAADAYFDRRELNADPACTPGLRFYQWMMEKRREDRLANQARLRALKRQRSSEVQIFCAHDPDEFEILAGRRLSEPARR